MKATQVIGNNNVIYTCLPISYDTLQTAISNQTFPITLASNILMKLPEKSVSLTEVQQVGNI